MSATPNNAAPGWGDARTLPPASAQVTPEADGHNALQGLLAFACIHQQAARRRREAQNTADSSLRLSREEELALDEILQLVAVRAIAITGADGVAIALAKDRAIVCRASAGKIAPDPGVKLDPNSGFSGACLRSGEIVRCDDSETDPRVNPQACRVLGTRSMIAVPLSARKRVIGLLEAFSTETCGFNDSDVRSLTLLGELILAAIRPEEEHHLAEMAREVLPETASKPQAVASAPLPMTRPSAPAATLPPISSAPTTVAAAPAAEASAPAVPAIISTQPSQADPAVNPKVLVDEKFAPVPVIERIPAADKAREKESSRIERTDWKTAPEETRAESITSKIEGTRVPIPAVVPAAAKREELEARIEQRAPMEKEPPGEKRSFLSLTLTAAGIMIAIGMAGVLIWRAQHLSQPISADTQTSSEIRTENDTPVASPAPPLKIGALVQVTGIHHSSAADMSTIVVDLEDQVQYETHSLDDPPRIYFDLHDTKLNPTAANQLNVDDAFLKRVRVAQPVEGITRVVLETKNQPDFSVSLDNNPYRLTIQVHKAGVAPGTSAPAVKPQPMLPKPSPVVSPTPGKSSASTQAAGTGLEIVLDAGHGGWDLGTVGKKGLLEKDLVLDIVQRLGTLLENRLGVNVVYTRQDDSYVSLEKRAEIANLTHADFFLSVHANYSDLSTARGVETYYTNTYSSVKARTPDASSVQQVNWSGVVDIRAKVKGAKLLASDIQQSLYGGQAARNPDIRNRGIKEAQYVVLTGTQMPAVLAEVSFVSSPADENRLQSSEYRQLIADALYKGIAKYCQESQRTKLASVRKMSQ
jgi:N-acetylmuramoyl-L-alanine amidase/putative methionine-R-sulfoxide reductase with GAF domain